MVASSLRKGKEDRTFRRKSKVRYRSGTEGSEGKTVYSDASRRLVPIRSKELLFVQLGQTPLNDLAPAECSASFLNEVLEGKTVHSGAAEGSVPIWHQVRE